MGKGRQSQKDLKPNPNLPPFMPWLFFPPFLLFFRPSVTMCAGVSVTHKHTPGTRVPAASCHAPDGQRNSTSGSGRDFFFLGLLLLLPLLPLIVRIFFLPLLIHVQQNLLKGFLSCCSRLKSDEERVSPREEAGEKKKKKQD